MIDEKRCYFFGRNPQVCDINVEHASCSRVHAALVYHKHLNRSFLVDLGSGNLFKIIYLSITMERKWFIFNSSRNFYRKSSSRSQQTRASYGRSKFSFRRFHQTIYFTRKITNGDLPRRFGRYDDDRQSVGETFRASGERRWIRSKSLMASPIFRPTSFGF